MPSKKYRNTRFSKPQSTAPALLGSSDSRATDHRRVDEPRTVNSLLTGLRRGTQESPSTGALLPPVVLLPGRRLPPGPPPPHSWLAQPRQVDAVWIHRGLPGVYVPARGSLVHAVLRRFAGEWEFCSEYYRHCVYDLPTHLREALIGYLARESGRGVSVADLRILLLPPPAGEGGGSDEGGDRFEIGNEENPSAWNAGIRHLDLTGSKVRLRDLADLLLCPPVPPISDQKVKDSWDAPDADALPPPPHSLPLLPSLTHLSLALRPSTHPLPSWKHLLHLSTHLPTLTHLSLAYWPAPSLTPNATAAIVQSAHGCFQYGGTGPYAHSLDGDWAEAVMVLRRLSRALYGLEYLDLTGCGAWVEALMVTGSGDDKVDWVGSWGKVVCLVMVGDGERARRLERYVRRQRAGRGRMFGVEGT